MGKIWLEAALSYSIGIKKGDRGVRSAIARELQTIEPMVYLSLAVFFSLSGRALTESNGTIVSGERTDKNCFIIHHGVTDSPSPR
ncbi:MAG: hypothetical protein D6728_00975 [Cyanobacteria bacterium J055]|nr:MAG: hypothetical protein D6728_00975 [Cyanobacteria bacterium J055]